MKDYWATRLADANHKRRTAQTAETRRIYETLAGHYRALEGQCQPSADCLRAGNDRSSPVKIAA